MIYLAVVLVYLGFLIAVGVYRSREVHNQDDFMVAGRSVPTSLLVATLVCTWIGSGSLFGGAGRAFREGFSALWLSAGAWAGIAIVYFLAPRVRRIAQYTVPDLLETRYTPLARLLGTISIVLAYLTIASYQFIGGGRLLSIVVPSLDPRAGQVIICVLVVIVIALAGMKSIVTLDLVNGILITGGILLAVPIVYHLAGGWKGLSTTLPETHFTPMGGPGVLAALGLFFPTFFLLLGESGMYQKFMSAKSEQDARRAVVGMIIGVIVVETALAATAVFGAALYWNNPAFHTAGGFDTATTETIILELARHDLPVLPGLVLLTGAVAIIFSTATTFLIVPSTNIARDLFQRFIAPDASPERVVRFQRWTVVALAAVSLLLTTWFGNILEMALFAYTIVGAAVTPALLAAFLWRRVTPAGGTASVAAGMLTTLVFLVLKEVGWETIPIGFGHTLPLEYDYVIYPAGLASIVCLIGVSLLTKPSPEEKWRPFFS